MRAIILCEGFDDVLILGYYLYKTQGWTYNQNAVFSNLYSFPKLNKKRQTIEVYEKENDFAAIWAVGGKDSFHLAYQFIYRINNQNPEQGINRVFILMDRDNNDIESTLNSIKERMNEYGLKVGLLSNNEKNQYFYEVEDELYCLEIIPVIVPFDRAGALETVLVQGIAEKGMEEAFIVSSANKYIDNVISSDCLQKYLQHERLVLKARLSSVISIINPDRSTALFNQVLLSWDWEKTDNVRRHFETISKYLGE